MESQSKCVVPRNDDSQRLFKDLQIERSVDPDDLSGVIDRLVQVQSLIDPDRQLRRGKRQ